MVRGLTPGTDQCDGRLYRFPSVSLAAEDDRQFHCGQGPQHPVADVGCGHEVDPMLTQDPDDSGVVGPVRAEIVGGVPADVEHLPSDDSLSLVNVGQRDLRGFAEAGIHLPGGGDWNEGNHGPIRPQSGVPEVAP